MGTVINHRKDTLHSQLMAQTLKISKVSLSLTDSSLMETTLQEETVKRMVDSIQITDSLTMITENAFGEMQRLSLQQYLGE